LLAQDRNPLAQIPVALKIPEERPHRGRCPDL
jgi:hypothetical protein